MADFVILHRPVQIPEARIEKLEHAAPTEDDARLFFHQKYPMRALLCLIPRSLWDQLEAEVSRSSEKDFRFSTKPPWLT